jgi:RimJ/RimL family protein N-acetyltransferase
MLNDSRVQEFLFFCPSPNEVYEGYFTPLADCAATFRAQLTVNGDGDGNSNEATPENIVLIVREKKTGVFAGNIGVMTPMSMFCPGNVEVGYQFNASAWGKGLATLGTKLLLHLAFHEMHAHKASADLYGRNKGSSRVLEKAGFLKEGSLAGYYKIPTADALLPVSEGEKTKSLTTSYVDVYDDKDLYGITLAQYQALPEADKYASDGCL